MRAEHGSTSYLRRLVLDCRPPPRCPQMESPIFAAHATSPLCSRRSRTWTRRWRRQPRSGLKLQARVATIRDRPAAADAASPVIYRFTGRHRAVGIPCGVRSLVASATALMESDRSMRGIEFDSVAPGNSVGPSGVTHRTGGWHVVDLPVHECVRGREPSSQM
jgi:hypothetical protein